ncbi:DUF317 domain-containing protein [Streptomyces sp. DSM 44915]|uniref:DUF317 domain-containing protein n=1 Tax=Streptomyces chisholmiae TaxID=3075540 RepID=A0ABU2JUA5_9ACTN|nr:DUF317 domain-containing protein [Streptomyces sp. DSM 44915]MDT0268572.1 DUF317 domain-containing protein [Streptomyces sp. DSM 44915]
MRERNDDYLVTPRYLAGVDDTSLVPDLLKNADWNTFNDDTGVAHHYSPDHRYCVSHPRLCQDATSGETRPAWHIWERRRVPEAATWQAVITTACPPEIVADFVEPLLTPQPAHQPMDSVTFITEGLIDADWTLDVAGGAITYTNPAGQLAARYQPPPAWATLHDLRTVAGWDVHARVRPGRVLWRAGFSATTPAHVIKTFCDAVLNPEPVPRYANDIDPALRPHLTIRRG